MSDPTAATEPGRVDHTVPFVSVVLPTRDRPELLDVALQALCRQSYPHERFEVVVAEDGTSARVGEVVRRFQAVPHGPAIRVVGGPRAGVNAARNLGSAHASGDLVVFTDDDVDAPATWLEELVRGSERHPDAFGFGGPVRIRYEGKQPRVCREHSLGKGEVDLGTEERSLDRALLIGANLAVRRSALEKVGGFDELMGRGSGADTELQHRLLAHGFDVVYVPQAWLWHRRTPQMLRIWSLLWQRFLRGVKEVLYRRKRGGGGSGRSQLVRVPYQLAHAWRARCVGGLLDAAGTLGLALGFLLERLGALRRSRRQHRA